MCRRFVQVINVHRPHPSLPPRASPHLSILGVVPLHHSLTERPEQQAVTGGKAWEAQRTTMHTTQQSERILHAMHATNTASCLQQLTPLGGESGQSPYRPAQVQAVYPIPDMAVRILRASRDSTVVETPAGIYMCVAKGTATVH
eukprot:scpid43113/ scgid6140/ 